MRKRLWKWSELYESIESKVYDYAHQGEDKESLLIVKKDFSVYNYFMNRIDIFDFTEDEKVGIALENPMFFKNGEIVFDTITHEKICVMAESLWEKIQ